MHNRSARLACYEARNGPAGAATVWFACPAYISHRGPRVSMPICVIWPASASRTTTDRVTSPQSTRPTPSTTTGADKGERHA
jgi:hypothetical protein